MRKRTQRNKKRHNTTDPYKNMPIEKEKPKLNLIQAKTKNHRLYVKSIVENLVTVCIGDAGCVDEETEFLCQDGWKKISEYNINDSVMQYDTKTRTGELVKPIKFIKVKSDGFYHIKNKYGLDQVLSAEHNILYETSKGNIGFKKCSDFIEMHNSNKLGFSGKILTNYNYNGKCLNLTEEEIRLHVAIKADGSLIKNIKSGTKYRIQIKKQRKKDRLEFLLKENNIEYYVKHKDDGYSSYSFYCNCSKLLSDWMFCSKRDAEIICDELKYWDGRFCPNENRMSDFSTSIKKDADAVQYFYNICGYRASIRKENRIGEIYKEKYVRKTNLYTVAPTKSDRLGFSSSDGTKINIPFIEPNDDEFKYCFEVPSGALVLRRKNKVFITGNSGKSYIALGIALEHINNEDYPQNKIVVTRPLVSVGTDVGALPGSIEEKVAPYFRPAYFNLLKLIGGDEFKLKKMIENRQIMFEPLELMRGMTYDNAIIIVDEAQDTTPEQILMVLTRIGKDSKVIINGDVDQTDIGYDNGLEKCLDVFERSDYAKIIEMGPEDQQRNAIINRICSDFKNIKVRT